MAELTLPEAKYHFQTLAPQIKALTGIEPDLGSLDVRLIKREEYWEQAVEPGMRFLGIDTIPRSEKARGTIAMLNRIQSKEICGMYEPRLKQYFFVPENLTDINEDGLAVVIGHELTHGTQFLATPEFCSVLQEMTKLTIGDYYFERDQAEVPGATACLEEMMTLIEGYAVFYQDALHQLYYMNAEFKPNNEFSISSPALDYNGLIERIPGFKEFIDLMEKPSPGPEDYKNLLEKLPSPEELDNILENTPALKELNNLMEKSPELKDYKELLEEFPSLMERDEGFQARPRGDKMDQYKIGAQIMAEAFNRGGPEATLALFQDSCDRAKVFIESYKLAQANRSQRISDALKRAGIRAP